MCSQDETTASLSIYSLNHYPRQAELFLDKDGKIVRMDVCLFVLRGIIQDYNPNDSVVKIRKTSRENRRMIQDELRESVALPLIDPWKWDCLSAKNETEFVVSDGAIVRYNCRQIKKNEIGRFEGKEIHVVLDSKILSDANFKPQTLNIYDFDERLYFSRSGCSGYVIQWKDNAMGVKIWEPHDEYKLRNGLYGKAMINELAKRNQLHQKFDLKADYRFSKNIRLIINGEEKRVSSRSPLEVNSCFFYGEAFLKYNKKGEVATIIVPCEEAE